MAKTKVKVQQKIAPQFLNIPTNLIAFSKTNPRKVFDDIEIHELAESLKKHGMIQPVAVREDADGYELIFGERRVRAALIAGMEEIPANVYPEDLNADILFEMQIIENLQRKNINAMEESDAFAKLITKKIDTAEQIADKLGVSAKYVYDRLALQKILPEVQDEIRNGRLTISHGKQFARLREEDQRNLWKSISENINDAGILLSDLKRKIAGIFSLRLSDAAFSTSDPKLVAKAGSCDKCQKRSGCNQLLFDDIQEDDICFDKNCYQQKEKAHAENVIKQLESEGEKVVRIAAGWMSKVDLPEGVIGYDEWDSCKEGDAHAIGVVVIANPYATSKVGEYLPIWLRSIEEDNDDREDICEADEVTSQNAISAKPSLFDHHNAICLLLWNKIIERYRTAADFQMNTTELMKGYTFTRLKTLHYENLERLCQLLEFEAVKNDDGYILFWDTINAIIDNAKDLARLCLLSELVLQVEPGNAYFDKDLIEEMRPQLAIAGIDFDAVISEYSESTEGAYSLPE